MRAWGKGYGKLLGTGCLSKAREDIGFFLALLRQNLCNNNFLLLVSFWPYDLGQAISPQHHHVLSWGLSKMLGHISTLSFLYI